jgi:hypothetical protein
MPFREGMGACEIDLVEFADILIKILPAGQIDAILREISQRRERGCCLLCGLDEAPHDKDGKPMAHGADVSNAEWHEMHEVDCFVTLIEEMRK